ncbi:hypothetical protein C2E23DRAFT_849157 [Lenzites betulinus]|nr:hypothetical protein C2E23DRAFT_849157 [Lenzites betulinus]
MRAYPLICLVYSLVIMCYWRLPLRLIPLGLCLLLLLSLPQAPYLSLFVGFIIVVLPHFSYLRLGSVDRVHFSHPSCVLRLPAPGRSVPVMSPHASSC